MIPLIEPQLTNKAFQYVNECLTTNWISSKGRFIGEFENLFEETFNYSHCVSTSSGTTALHLALETLGIGDGDEVLVPDLTFAASINAVLHANAKPVIVDINRATWNLCIEKCLEAITNKTKAIVVVNLYGIPFDTRALRNAIGDENIYIIEDSAESLGATIDGDYTGRYADASTFSFYGNKVITTGEGGMVVFNSIEDRDRALLLRDHGMSRSRRYHHKAVGYNYRMTNIQAAIGLSQLEFLPQLLKTKRQVFENYDMAFRNKSLSRQECAKDIQESPWLYTVLVPDGRDRDGLLDHLQAKGIETRPAFIPLSDMEIYSGYSGNECLVAKEISSRGFSLPSSFGLTAEDQEIVIDEVLRWVES